jgi:MoaA/NifB/PqqE/SkfB family radical SAM enzyme
MNSRLLDEAIAEISQTLNQHPGRGAPFFLIAGAGVSTPEVPLSHLMIEEFQEKARTPPGVSTRTPIDEYSRWFEAAYPSPASRQQYLKEKIKKARISHANFQLAHLLAASGYLRTVVTPNFDDLLSRALQLFGVKHDVYDTESAIVQLDPDGDELRVVHVHGTYRDYDLSNLYGEITERAQNTRMVNKLLHLLNMHSPIVVGYAGWEHDILMTALKTRLWDGDSPATLPYRIYWFCYDDAVADRLPHWLTSHREVVLVTPGSQGVLAPDRVRRLPASRVMSALIDELVGQAPLLTTNPLGFFLQHLRRSLPADGEDIADEEFYLFCRRILGFYPNRDALAKDFDPIRLIGAAKENSEVLVAGRTLLAWANCGAEMEYAAENKGLYFRFLLSSEGTEAGLDRRQAEEVRDVQRHVRARFSGLMARRPLAFEVRETEQLILDGITFTTTAARSDSAEQSGLRALFDINAAPGRYKPTLVLACTCGMNRTPPSESCTVHGLYARTEHIFEQARRLEKVDEGGVRQIIDANSEGMSRRKNSVRNYCDHVVPVLRRVAGTGSGVVAGPLSVQVQVAARCSTRCEMCDHWRNGAANDGLSIDEWSNVFLSLARGGTRTLVFSGGEPLASPDIVELLAAARMAGLEVGLLTSGLIGFDGGGEERRRREVFEAIRACAAWVAISIDGTREAESRIRRPLGQGGRWVLLRQLCEALSGGPDLSATVTLQRKNIGMELQEIRASILSLGIERVHFKFATGGRQALDRPRDFLLDVDELSRFLERLFSSPLPQDRDNNLDYLRRSICGGFFTLEDISDGTPVQSYYRKQSTMCFTPYLHALIDYDGKVYPCCHLYRDNHGADPKSQLFRETHRMGSLRDHGCEFLPIWDGEAYQGLRKTLQTIDPTHPDFLPCGECTRHYRHNKALTEILRFVERAPGGMSELEQYAAQLGAAGETAGPVWF